jgi:hypothetical protein
MYPALSKMSPVRSPNYGLEVTVYTNMSDGPMIAQTWHAPNVLFHRGHIYISSLYELVRPVDTKLDYF